MSNQHLHEPAAPNADSIVEWLALARCSSGPYDVAGLRRQLFSFREAPLPPPQRQGLLDRLHEEVARVTQAQLPLLPDVSLPVSHKTRQRVRIIQTSLEMLVQEHLNSLAGIFDPQAAARPHSPHDNLKQAMQCLSWHLLIGHLVAAPPDPGIWQQFHSIFRTYRQLENSIAPDPGEKRRAEEIYLSSLLISVAQPASFISRELEFIHDYIDRHIGDLALWDKPPAGHEGVFWIAPERDMPAHALARRTPPPEIAVLYFACDLIARRTAQTLAALAGGKSADDLALPKFADTPAGQRVLKRLIGLWGRPAKRKFPRRRNSYRANLCAGLDQLWPLLRTPAEPAVLSEWIVTNESPDGYALMHVSGATGQLHVGDIVALRPHPESSRRESNWTICLVRWALSENPEHVELGLQLLATKGIPAMLALPQRLGRACCTPVLLLPQAPPLRPFQALATPADMLGDLSEKLILLVEEGNLAVHELRATQLDEQTATIDIFNVEPDGRP